MSSRSSSTTGSGRGAYDYGRLTVSIAYGGDFYCFVDADAIGVELGPHCEPQMLAVAQEVNPRGQRAARIRHPKRPDINRCYQTLLTSAATTVGDYRQAIMCPPGSLDRSPCGTGTSARVALLHTRGELDVGEERRFEGPLGTFFSGAVARRTGRASSSMFAPASRGGPISPASISSCSSRTIPCPVASALGRSRGTCRRRRPEAPNMTDTRKPPLRSASWFSRLDNTGFEHRTHLKARGAAPEMFDGRPVIGIANSASDLVPCNAHLTALAEWVSRGVLENGGYPLVFPTMSIGDSIMRPSGMLFRNLMSMELEALLRANPLDGVVLLTGCDNTAPAYMMGAASVDLPTIVVHGGAMVSGYVGQRTIGSGTDIFKLYDDFRTGRMSEAAFLDSEASMSRSDGHCNTMGTAATMGCLAEALGLSLPGSAAIPR